MVAVLQYQCQRLYSICSVCRIPFGYRTDQSLHHPTDERCNEASILDSLLAASIRQRYKKWLAINSLIHKVRQVSSYKNKFGGLYLIQGETYCVVKRRTAVMWCVYVRWISTVIINFLFSTNREFNSWLDFVISEKFGKDLQEVNPWYILN